MVFTDIHQQTNLDLLYRYILHRTYDFEFTDKAQATQKNSVFIPSGFDSKLLIESLGKGNSQDDKVFDEVIKKPGAAGQNQKVK